MQSGSYRVMAEKGKDEQVADMRFQFAGLQVQSEGGQNVCKEGQVVWVHGGMYVGICFMSLFDVCLVGVYALGVDWCLGRECHVVWKQKENFVADETKMSP